MPKKTYTPEEVQKIEKTLLIEKQRVSDLESKLASFLKSKQGEEEEESETLRLRRMVITFKKKYQQLLHELSQKENGSKESTESIDKLQEAQEENAALIKQQQLLKELLKQEKQRKIEANKQFSHKKEEYEAFQKEWLLANETFKAQQEQIQKLQHALALKVPFLRRRENPTKN